MVLATMKEVAQAAGVSQATVSRVLNGVQSVDAEIVERVWQAATSLNYRMNEAGRSLRLGTDAEYGPRFETRSQQNAHVKRRIAEFAAHLIRPGEVIILDSGTTVSEMASFLPDEVILYSNSLALLQTAAKRNLDVHLAPGLYVPAMAGVFGPDTEEYLSRLKPNKYFLSSLKVDIHTGMYNVHPSTGTLKQVVFERAEESILLVDHDKFCDAGLPAFSPLQRVQKIITDFVPENYRSHVFLPGIEVVEIDKM